MPLFYPVKVCVFKQQLPRAAGVYLLPGFPVAVYAGGEAPKIAEVRGLIHIAAFPHDTVRKGIEKKTACMLPHPLNEGRQGKAAKIPVPVLRREKAHFPDLQVMRGKECMAGEQLLYGL